MQKKLSNIIRKAAFLMIPIASAICYAGISDDVYASSETTEDSLIYNFRDAKKEGTITFVKRWKDGKKEEDRNIPNIEISTKKPRKNVSGYTVIFHGNGMTFADGSTENEMLFNSSMNIIGGQYNYPGGHFFKHTSVSHFIPPSEYYYLKSICRISVQKQHKKKKQK